MTQPYGGSPPPFDDVGAWSLGEDAFAQPDTYPAAPEEPPIAVHQPPRARNARQLRPPVPVQPAPAAPMPTAVPVPAPTPAPVAPAAAPAAPMVPPRVTPPQPPPTPATASAEPLATEAPPTQGMRGWIHTASGGRLMRRPGPAEVQQREAQRQALLAWEQEQIHQRRRAQLTQRLTQAMANQPGVVSFYSPKGGIGKTTTTLCTAICWKMTRTEDNTIVIDGNSDAGTGSARMNQSHGWNLRQFAQMHHQITSSTAFKRELDRPRYGVMVIASESSPEREEFSAQEYGNILSLLKQYGDLITNDCGTTYTSVLTNSIFDHTDQLVFIVEPSIDCLKLGESTIQAMLKKNDRDRGLIESGILVVNNVWADSPYLDDIQRYYGAIFRQVVFIRHDPALEKGGVIAWEQLGPGIRDDYLNLAVVVAEGLAAKYPLRPREQAPAVYPTMNWIKQVPPQAPPTAQPTDYSGHSWQPPAPPL